MSTWTAETGNMGASENAATAAIETDSSKDRNNLKAPYLKVSNANNNAIADTITLTKGFTVPGTGIVRASFRWSSDSKVANADVRLADDNGNAIIIGSGKVTDENIDTNAFEVDGGQYTPYGGADYRVYVCTKSGETYKSYALGDAYNDDLANMDMSFAEAWRNIEIVANTSNERVNTTIAGQDISLGSGVYAVAMIYKVETTQTNILKGYLPTGMGSFSKFSVMSKGWLSSESGIETRLDDLSVGFEPVTYAKDADFVNWRGVVWGELDASLTYAKAANLIQSDAAGMSDLGVGWTRFFVGQNYNQDRIDSMVRAADENGVKVLMSYIKKTGSTEYGTAEEEAAEMEYLTALVNKYKSVTSYWEIGNEQNLAWLDSGRDNAKLENYAKHLRDCYNTIKTADPNATVILGGLSEYLAEDWVSAFANITVDEHPAYTYCDEAAFHPYALTPDDSVARVQQFVTAMKTYWGADMPVWITEVGFHAESSWDGNRAPGMVGSEDIKAEYLTEVMNKIHAEQGTVQRPVMWYILHEVGNGDVAGYGLTKNVIYDYGVSTTKLAAYAAMKNLAATKESAVELPINDTFAGMTGTLPLGWTSNLDTNSDTRYAKVSNENMGENTAYLRIHKDDSSSADEITVDREFEIPAGGALINISFDYLTANDQKGFKKIVLMNDTTEAVIIEHKYVNNGNRVVLTDKDDTDSVNWPATVLGDELSTWRHFDFTINCSNAELGGLGAGEYLLSFDNGEAVKGKLRGGVTTLNKISFTSGVYINADIGIDNLNISKMGFESNAAYDVAMEKTETDSIDTITNADGTTTYNVGYIADVEGAYSSVIIEKKYGVIKGLPLNVDLSANEATITFGLQINGLSAPDEIQKVYISKRTIDFNSRTAIVPAVSSEN